MKTLTYLWALMVANMKSYGPERKRLFIMAFFMMVQNTMFFVIWIFFFNHVSNLKGWGVEEYSRMLGLAASSIGLSLFFLNGSRTIAYRVLEGTMDGFITKPREALPSLLLSASSPASLGDVLYGPLLWLTLGNVPLNLLPWFILLTLISSVLFTAVTVLIFSIAFWMKGSVRFPEQLFEMLLIFALNILHGQSFGVKLIAFTIVPAGFITYLPARLMQEYDPVLLAILLAGTVFYVALAWFVFRAGLRRYVRGAV